MTAIKIEQKYKIIRKEAVACRENLKKKPVIMVGMATCGRAAGALKVKEAFMDAVKDNNIDAVIIEAGCIGHCYAEPLAIIANPGFPTICYGKLDDGLSRRIVEDFLVNGDPCYEYALAALDPNDDFPAFNDFPRGVYEQKMILDACGLIDPHDIMAYVAVGGYAALAKSLSMKPAEVLAEIKLAHLRGRGGAGFPAGEKWEASTKNNEEIRFVICNGDEGDPGAFMDRSLLESNPHLVIEGMIICAYAISAREGYLYIRAEYPQAISQIEKAIAQAMEREFLGPDILDSGFSFDLQVFQGSGAFVCGEGTALVNSMEGKLALPESRPPRLVNYGLRGKPTVLNNVKTYAYVPFIINNGAGYFRNTGTLNNPGTAVFALVGKVNNTGLTEVPMGTSLRNLIYDIGGGIPGNKQFKAVQIGGPSGGCLPESALDMPVNFDSLHKVGAIMGSGGLVVLDEDDCMVRIARYFLEFTQQESCGKCSFCRLGTKHMLDILLAITRGEGTLPDLKLLQELSEDVRGGSLCNLGKTAPNPILSTLRYFRDEYEAHINEKRCPARMCSELIAFYILPEKCSKLCNICVGSCPTEAIYTRDDGLKAIYQEKCVKCNNCLKACPPGHDAVVKLSPPQEVNKRENNLKEGSGNYDR